MWEQAHHDCTALAVLATATICMYVCAQSPLYADKRITDDIWMAVERLNAWSFVFLPDFCSGTPFGRSVIGNKCEAIISASVLTNK